VTTPPPGHPIDFQTILQACADAPGSPRVSDFGVPLAAAARIAAHLLDQDVYHGAHVKAAVLLDTLMRHPWLEHHQASASWTVARTALTVNGYELREDVKPAEIAALLTRVAGAGIPLTDLARTLREWTAPQEPSS
jgi:death-on-curing protein